MQPDLVQQLLDQSKGWDPEKYAALERFMTRPRLAHPPGSQQAPSPFIQKVRQQQQQQQRPASAGISSGPFASFYNILQNAPPAAFQLPAPSAAGASTSGQQQVDGGVGALRRTPARGSSAAGRYDPYARPPPSGGGRPLSRAGTAALPPSPMARWGSLTASI